MSTSSSSDYDGTSIVAIAAVFTMPLLMVFCTVKICCIFHETHDADIELGRPPRNRTPVQTRREPLSATNNVVVVYRRQESDGDDHDNGVVEAESCSICLEELKNGDTCLVLSCHHIYHDFCINLWLRINKHCPLCRNLVQGSFIKGDDDSCTTDQNLPGELEPAHIQV